jgi:hypothetical protein
MYVINNVIVQDMTSYDVKRKHITISRISQFCMASYTYFKPVQIFLAFLFLKSQQLSRRESFVIFGILNIFRFIVNFVAYWFSCPRHVMAGAYSVTMFRPSFLPSFCHSVIISFRSLSKKQLHIFNSNLTYGYVMRKYRPSLNLVMV